MRLSWALLIATSIWLPNIHRVFEVELSQNIVNKRIAPKAQELAEQHLRIWRSTELRTQELANMQRRNPEWDFMSRMYFILALTNMAMHTPSFKQEALEIIDLIIEDTLALEAKERTQLFSLSLCSTRSLGYSPSPKSFYRW